MNMRSTTGRSPPIAAPTPSRRCRSEIGVSTHPLGAELLVAARERVEHTAVGGDVLADEEDVVSSRMTWARPSLKALT